MPSRRWRAAAILVPSMLLATLGAATSATAATTSNPSLITSDWACSNGVCEVGPGNVGVAFGAELNGTGGPPTNLPDCPYIISVISGSLPPGLQLGGVCGNIISGNPAQAGTYPFTVQVTSLGSDETGVTEPSGTQQLTITIGTGKSDRLLALTAGYNEHTKTLSVGGYDANSGALYTLSVTSTGQVVIPAESAAGLDGGLPLTAGPGFNWPCPGETTCSLTVSDNLGSSATVTLPPAKY
ncbi:MAG TPA: hypothetical protein VN969_13165 [Streptosporangiaceae bacterium]|jgi:hypothetical protein|nr:hypothetical protein [Streptosporangiaceae bacterium]